MHLKQTIKSNVEYEPELEKSYFLDLVDECKEILVSMGKLLEGMTVKIDIDSEPPVLIETEVVEKPEPKVIEDPEPELEVEEAGPEIVAELVSL